MEIKDIVNKLINGETVVIKSAEQKREVQKQLREIKKNCTIVLSQLKEQL